MIGLIILCIPLVIGYLAIRHGANRARRDNFSEADFQNEDYYREILKEFSTAELSYIDNLKIEERRDIASTILKLKLKNKIDIVENQIIVLDSNTNQLKKTEKFILEHIKEGRIKIYKSGQFETYFMAEAIEDGLISKNRGEGNKTKKSYLKGIVITVILFMLAYLWGLNFDNLIELFGNETIPTIGLVFSNLACMITIFILPIYLLAYNVIQSTLYLRTKKGEELNKKIEGLKKYIRDYSSLYGKGRKDLIIWEEYLIYSVIFDINDTTIVNEISNLIDIEHEYGRIYLVEKKELKENQIIYIDNQRYVTSNMIEYKKGNTILQKYSIIDENNFNKWFVVEMDESNKKVYYLYDEYKNEINITENEVFVRDQKHKLFRQGDTSIREHFGKINWTQYCMYYDYISADGNNILSLEQWTEMTQQHIGIRLTYDRIKITEEILEKRNNRKRLFRNYE